MDDLLDDVTVLVGFYFAPESDKSSDNVSNNSSEDEESNKISIYFCAIRRRSCSFACSVAALQLVGIQEIVAPY